MGYTLVKFGADSFTIQGDTECDRRTDGQTQGDSNSSAGLRPVELTNKQTKILMFIAQTKLNH